MAPPANMSSTHNPHSEGEGPGQDQGPGAGWSPGLAPGLGLGSGQSLGLGLGPGQVWVRVRHKSFYCSPRPILRQNTETGGIQEQKLNTTLELPHTRQKCPLLQIMPIPHYGTSSPVPPFHSVLPQLFTTGYTKDYVTISCNGIQVKTSLFTTTYNPEPLCTSTCLGLWQV